MFHFLRKLNPITPMWDLQEATPVDTPTEISMVEQIALVKEIHGNVDLLAELTKDHDVQLEEIQSRLQALVSRSDFSVVERRLAVGFGLKADQETTRQQLEIEKRAIQNEIAETVKERDSYEELKELRAKYPLRKFILMSDLKKVAQKYDLALGYTFHYTGELPEANLRDLENYKKLPESLDIYKVYSMLSYSHTESFKVLSKEELEQIEWRRKNMIVSSSSIITKQEGFIIACPPSDLTQTIDHIEVTRMVLDPIVVSPVLDPNIVEVVTKWGPEALDEIVQNPALN